MNLLNSATSPFGGKPCPAEGGDTEGEVNTEGTSGNHPEWSRCYEEARVLSQGQGQVLPWDSDSESGGPPTSLGRPREPVARSLGLSSSGSSKA